MEESSLSFFSNGIKLHIESSFKKLNEIESIIFNGDFEEILLNKIFINNINLFREIISQNNLNFSIFWNNIGKLMKPLVDDLINKFEEELNKEKNNPVEDNKEKIELGNINILKLKIINISFYLITNVDSDNFLNVKSQEKDTLDKLLNSYIRLKQEKNDDFSEFIKNYIIKIALLINENSRILNSGFLKYLSYAFYNIMQSITNNESIKHLKIYVDQVINNPKLEINKYINIGASNKKIIKKEKISRSRGASFDIRDPYTNNNVPNINIEKNNKKISDFFKRDKIITSMNKGGSSNSDNNEELKKPESKISSYSFGAKNLAFPSGNELNLMNFGSGISNISNFSFANNEKNASNKISLDDSLNLSLLFPKPMPESENVNIFKDQFYQFFKCPVVPTMVKKQSKRKRPTDRIRYNKELVDIRKFINKKRKSENGDDEKELKELREMINSSFYGNENEDNIINIDEDNNKNKIKEIYIKKEELFKNNNKEKKDDNILIFKTPNKADKTPNKADITNQENMDENIMKNIGILGIQRNLQTLFDQKIYG